ncbi:secretion protein HlyD [Promicromonospora iranensis]|uniref:Multidrug efflux pump subunit AcrA (Membrane-fusion protein) n=1 Tax=Promicromonospora iranensis TaxID=1105144 RepID=A0ABU2CM32_9MICO|nr:secretion protein HlyD [Promicromonospora iranensis]MDR7382389.1 multidrug efflux pump subunit AcrA (membrane-fusion protein) [Promicromonospora iranensis]
MGAVRQYVFPTARIIIWAVIAAALVALALRGAELDPPDALQPTGEITESVIPVAKGSVTNAVTVPASVVSDPPVEIKATADGVIAEIEVDGAKVGKDTRVLWIKSEKIVEPVVEVDEETGEETVTEQEPEVTWTSALAPASGTVDITVLKDQAVTVGETIGTVSPGTLSVSGTLTADQQYRLVGATGKAKVTLKGGPAPFTCTGLTIGEAPGGAGVTGEESMAEAPTDATGAVRCAIPRKIKAFPGLGGEIEITNGNAKGVVVVPISAVLGTSQTGKVWTVAKEGAEPEERDVALGLTDGLQVEITEGLRAGEQILEFTPLVDGTEGGVDCEDTTAYDQASMEGDMATMQAFEKECFG